MNQKTDNTLISSSQRTTRRANLSLHSLVTSELVIRNLCHDIVELKGDKGISMKKQQSQKLFLQEKFLCLTCRHVESRRKPGNDFVQ